MSLLQSPLKGDSLQISPTLKGQGLALLLPYLELFITSRPKLLRQSLTQAMITRLAGTELGPTQLLLQCQLNQACQREKAQQFKIILSYRLKPACITGDLDWKQNQTDMGVVITVEKQSYIKYFKVTVITHYRFRRGKLGLKFLNVFNKD